MKTILLSLIAFASAMLSNCTHQYTAPTQKSLDQGILSNMKHVEPETLKDQDYIVVSAGAGATAPLLRSKF